MSETKDEKFQTYTTPVGILLYPRLNKPGVPKGVTNAKPAYKTFQVLDGPEALGLKAFVEAQAAEFAKREKIAKPISLPIEPLADAEGNVVEGALRFKFSVDAITETAKSRAGQAPPWNRKPTIYQFVDGVATPCVAGVNEPALGSGTRAQIAFQVYCWKSPIGAGVKLQPIAVMVHELIEYTRPAKPASEYGFAAQAPTAGNGAQGGDF